MRLRATGRDHDEVGRLLLVGRPVLRSERVDRQVDQAVEKVSSSSVTEWIAEHPAFVARASRVGAQVETLLYRKLRTAALRQFERDLNDVWVECRRRADEVAARHRHTMAWIRDLRWRNRRLQKRGIVHAILSILVELAVLQPAIALERKTVGLKRAGPSRRGEEGHGPPCGLATGVAGGMRHQPTRGSDAHRTTQRSR